MVPKKPVPELRADQWRRQEGGQWGPTLIIIYSLCTVTRKGSKKIREKERGKQIEREAGRL
jgi:hypothetical protein